MVPPAIAPMDMCTVSLDTVTVGAAAEDEIVVVMEVEDDAVDAMLSVAILISEWP